MMSARVENHDLWPAPAVDPAGQEDVLDLLEIESPPAHGAHWIAPTLAIVAAVVWTGGMLVLAGERLLTLDPIQLAQFLAALASLPVLLGVVWLLTQRNSRSEARRFAVTAYAMRSEAATLERRIAALSRTLMQQREQLAHQLATLSNAGDAAAIRLETVGRGLAAEVTAADTHAHSLAAAAERARGSVAELLAAMPRAQAEGEDVGRRIEQAGMAAAAHVAALDAQLAALADRAHEADTLANTAAARLAGHVERIRESGDTAGGRLEKAAGAMGGTVEALIGQIEAALARLRDGLATQGEDMLALVGAHQAALDDTARNSATALGERVGAVGETVERIGIRLERQRAAGDELIGRLHDGFGDVEQRLETLHIQGAERSQRLAGSISALNGSTDAMTEALRAGEAMAIRAIGSTESLLIALDAASREIDETLPDALQRLDGRVAETRSIVGQTKPELLALVTAAESTHDAIESIANVIGDQRGALDRLSSTLIDTLENGRGKADALGASMNETIARTRALTDDAAPGLEQALLRIRQNATAAAADAREALAGVIPEAAAEMERAAGDALRRASGDTVQRQVYALAEAGEAAVTAASRATERLADHIQAIAEQTALVEARLEEAREVQQAADRGTLSRRVSLLIDQLNSASIDIAKAFSADVADSAWAAYLKGDRGVFTRRAVRLLDGGDAREIARLYDADEPFREQVNRYIHDFESMLRAILDQRDGSSLGVTLLSSDMGKLYVALAQAIERLP